MATNAEVLVAIAEIKVNLNNLVEKVDDRMDSVEEKVKNLQDKVLGNGKPGVIVEQILQSGKIDQLLVYAKNNATNIEKLNETIPPKWLARNWYKIIIFLTLMIVVLHSILPEVSIIQLIGMLK